MLDTATMKRLREKLAEREAQEAERAAFEMVRNRLIERDCRVVLGVDGSPGWLFGPGGVLGVFPARKLNEHDWPKRKISGFLKIVIGPKYLGGENRVFWFGPSYRIELFEPYAFALVDEGSGRRLVLRQESCGAWRFGGLMYANRAYSGSLVPRTTTLSVI